MTETHLAVTLNAIRAKSPCEDGWRKLLAHLGKTSPDDAPVSFRTILESNGLDDALWCLRALPEELDAAVRVFNCDVTERALRFVPEGEDRPRRAIEVARRFAVGDATEEELAAAGAAAGDAVWAAARAAAGDAVWAAAGDAARAAARAAAAAAARDAARAAAWDAAGDAVWAAARAAARAAAGDAARAAAGDAARDAAGDAEEAEQHAMFLAWLSKHDAMPGAL